MEKSITIQAGDVLEARRIVGLGRNPDAFPFIEVQLDYSPGNISFDGPKDRYSFRSYYGTKSESIGGLTLKEVMAKIKEVFDKNEKYLAEHRARLQRADKAGNAAALKVAREHLAKAKKVVKDLERR